MPDDALRDNQIVNCKFRTGVVPMSRKDCIEGGGNPQEHVPDDFRGSERRILEQIFLYRKPNGKVVKGTLASCAKHGGQLLGPVLREPGR